MKHVFPRRVLQQPIFKFISAVALTLSTPISLLAGPEGGEVVGGEGNISRSGNTTTIEQATDRMAIDWQTFDVDVNERVHYIQPGSDSVSLNRILSHRGSQIHGRIDANGHVILMNPNGILFGENSVVNVGGILASGLSIDADDFMNGDFAFSAIEGTDGLVINAGLINAATGGNVALLGQQVQNDGMISAQLGSVTLASGKEAVVTFDGEGLLGVQVTESILQDDIGVDAAVINNGEITAEDGQILISAAASQSIFSQAVNSGEVKHATSVVVDEDGSFTLNAGANVVNTGVLSASGDAGGAVVVLGENVTSSGEISADSSASESAGMVEVHSVDTTLVTESGSVSAVAMGGEGGDIKLLGDKVGLTGEAQVNASGETGGGQVLIGGDETGSNPLVRNAEFIYLGENTNVSTDALIDGDGGRLITFAENTARIYGSLSAIGGELGGDGGFIETSGLIGFDILSTPDITAANGQSGHWLIDPYNITIVSSLSTQGNIDNTGDNYFSDGTPASIRASTLEGALSDGATVTLSTTIPLDTDGEPIEVVGEDGSITFNVALNDDFGSGATNTLVLNAHGSIDTNGFDISSSTDQLNVVLNANYDASAGDVFLDDSLITTNGGYIAINADNVSGPDLDNGFTGTLSTGGGDFYVGVADNANGTINFGAATFADPISGSFFSAGTIDVSSDSGGGNIDLNVNGDATLGAVTIGDTRNALFSWQQGYEPRDSGSFTSSLFTVDAANIIVNGALTYGVDDYVANHTTTAIFNADNDITFNSIVVDNTAGGNDSLNLILNADFATPDGGNIFLGTSTIDTSGGYVAFNGNDVGGTGTFNSGDGSYEGLASGYAGTLTTNGGDVYVGVATEATGELTDADTGTDGLQVSNDPISGAFRSSDTIATYSDDGDGDVLINTDGDVELYFLLTGDTDGSANMLETTTIEINTGSNFLIDGGLIDYASVEEYLTEMTVNANGDITITDTAIDNNGSPTNDLNLVLNADVDGAEIGDSTTDGNITISGDFDYNQDDHGTDLDTNIYLGGGNFAATGVNFTLGATEIGFNAGQINTEGGNVSIDVTGDVTLYDNDGAGGSEAIITGGGSFTVSGATSFDNYLNGNGGGVTTGAANGGGDIDITTSGDATLGAIVIGDTRSSGEPTEASDFTTSSFTVDANNIFVNGAITYGVDDNVANHTTTAIFNADNDITFNNIVVDNTAGGNDSLNLILNADFATPDGGNIFLGASTIDTSGGYVAFNGNDVGGTGTFNSGDGSYEGLASGYAGTLTTNGGNVYVGVAVADDSHATLAEGEVDTNADPFAVSNSGDLWFTESVDVSSDAGGGNIDINATGDATLGAVQIGDTRTSGELVGGATTSTFDVDANNIFIEDDIAFGINDTEPNHTSILTFTAVNDITFTDVMIDNSGGGEDILNMSLNAGASGTITVNDGSQFWTGGGVFSTAGHHFTLGDVSSSDEGSIDTEGGAINLLATGDVLIGGAIETDGGSFTVSGATSFDNYLNGNGGGVTTGSASGSGDIDIQATGDVTLGQLGEIGNDANGTGDFTLNVSAGDDLILEQALSFDLLTGTGTNNLNFSAGNSDTLGTENGIVLNAAITRSTGDQANINFGIVGSDTNLTDFTNDAAIDSNGGAVNIFVDGNVSVENSITTNGGDFTVGDTITPVLPISFDSSSAAIDTSGDPAGSIVISTMTNEEATGDVSLGDLIVDSTDAGNSLGGNVTVVSGNDIRLINGFDFDRTGTSGSSFRTLSLTADNNIYIQSDIDDGAEGDRDTLNVVLNANVATGSTDDTFGSVILTGDIYTGGGNLTISGYDFDSTDDVLHTGFSNVDGGGSSTTGGNILLDMTGSVTLGAVATENPSDNTTGNLTINSNNTVTQAAGVMLVNGTTIVNTDIADANSDENVTFANVLNDFQSTVAITHGENVSISDQNSLVLGASEVSGNLTLVAGGEITDAAAMIIEGTTSITAGANAVNFDIDHDFQSAVTVVSASQLDISDSNDLILGDIAISGSGAANTIDAIGGAITQSTGNINIDGAGSLTITADSVQTQNITTTGLTNQAGGNVNITANTSTITVGDINANGGVADAPGGGGQANRQDGLSGGVIDLQAQTGITTGSISANGSNGEDGTNSGCSGSCITGANGGAGGSVTINTTSGAVEISSLISTNGGSGHVVGTDINDMATGGDAGAVTITGTSISLGGSISAQGGVYADRDTGDTNGLEENGDGGNITLNGDVSLTSATITFDTTLTGAPPAADNGASVYGDILINGLINGTTAHSQNLIINAAAVDFDGNVGGSRALGAITVTANGAINSDADAITFDAESFTATGASFNSSDINTAGALNQPGGGITINAATGDITVGNLITSGGTATSGGAGQNGGAVNLDAGTINTGSITTRASDADTGAGGQGGAVNIDATSITVGSINAIGGNSETGAGTVGGIVAITADDDATDGTPDITLNGDIDNRSGLDEDGSTRSTVQAVATLTLSGDAPASGTVTLNRNAFISSNVTINGSVSTADTLMGLDVGAFWTSSSDGGGVIDADQTADNSPIISFSGFETLEGGSGADTFTLAHAFNQVAGGEGADIFNVDVGTTVSIFGGESGEAPDTEIDTLNGLDGAVFWSSTGSEDGTMADAEDLGAATWTVTFEEIENLQGGTEVDTFTIAHDFNQVAGGEGADNFNLNAGINVHVSGGEDTPSDVIDTLTLSLTSADVAFWESAGGETGTIDDDDDSDTDPATWVVTFDQIETLQGGAQVDGFTLSHNFTNILGRANNDNFTISGPMSATQINGNTGNDEFVLNADFSGDIYGGEDNDTITVNAAQTNTNLFGDTGNDIFNLDASVADSNTDTSDFDVSGGDGNDTFNIGDVSASQTIAGGEDAESERAPLDDDDEREGDLLALVQADQNRTWTLSSLNSGRVGGVSFSEIENLDGSDGGNDTFDFDFYIDPNDTDSGIGRYEDTVDGRGGENIVDLTFAGGTIDITLGGQINFVDSANIVLGAGANSVFNVVGGTSLSTPTFWTIYDFDGVTDSGPTDITDGVNDGVVSSGSNETRFIDFGVLQGDANADQFTVQSGASIVRVDGDGGTSNTLTYSDADGNNQWVLDDANRGDINTDVLEFLNIQEITGGGSDTLTARAQNNTWTIGATNTVEQTVEPPATANDTLTFSGMDTLTGNDQQDTFNINAAVDWFFNGGGGDDVFRIGDSGSVLGAESGIDGGDAGTNGDRLIARDDVNIWEIRASDDSDVNTIEDNTNDEYVADFKDIEVLEGSDTNADTFDFSTFLDLQIVAGSGVGDEANYADVTGDVLLTIGASNISGVDHFVGNNDGLAATTNNTTLGFTSLTGETVQWRIIDVAAVPAADGINDGDINNTITFVNVNNLSGSEGNDIFTFDQSANAITGLSGMITGGGNSGSFGDRIASPNTATNWVVAPLSGSESLTYNNGLDDGGSPATPLQTTTQFSGIETLDSGTANDTFSVGQTATIILNAGDGSDTLNLPDQDMPITLGDAVDGIQVNDFEVLNAFATRQNSLTVTSATNNTVNWEITSANSGTVQINSGDITEFNNFQVLNGSLGNDTFDFSNGGSVSRTGTDNGAVNGGAGTNTIIGQAVATDWRIDGAASGSLTETGETDSYVESFSQITALQGQDAVADRFTLTSTGSFTGTINGVGGSNSLTVGSVTGQTNEWRLLDDTTTTALVEPDSVRRLIGTTPTSDIEFSNISSLIGGTGVDEFVFRSNGVFAGTIDALDGAGVADIVNLSNVDIVSVSLGATTINGVQNAERVIGNGTNSTLNGLNSGTNEWRVSVNDTSGQPISDADGENDGTLENGGNSIEFINFANLTGGNDAIDQFTIESLGSVTGTLTGGTPGTGTITDSVITQADNTNWILSSSDSGAVDSNLFTGIERIVANGANDTLRGLNQNNLWTVTGVNIGRVAESNDANPINFENMENLSGHQANDVFVLIDNDPGADGQIEGTIAGTDTAFTDGSGTDQLTVQSASGVVVQWIFDQDDYDGDDEDEDTVSVTNRVENSILIEQFNGGAGNDVFSINDADVVARAIGNTGSDTVRLGYSDADARWDIGGAATDTVAIASRGTVTFSTVEIAEGSNIGGDDFFINGTQSTLESLSGRGGDDDFTIVTTEAIDVTIIAGAGTDTLVGPNITDTANEWVIDSSTTANDANTLNWDSDSDTGIDFSGVENFTGGSQQDNFTVRSPNIVGTIRGSAIGVQDDTIDQLEIARSTGLTEWDITGNGSGDVEGGFVTSFIDIERLTGSDATDDFDFEDASAFISDLIDGAGGSNDSVDVIALTDGVVIELGATVTAENPDESSTPLPNLHVNNVETIVAASDASPSVDDEANNWLVNNTAGDYRWNIDARNEGDLILAGGTTNNISFENFGHLRGSVSGSDTFDFTNNGQITGIFEGGGAPADATDVADFADMDSVVVLVGGRSSTGINFDGIERVVGNNDDATLSINSGTNLWAVSDGIDDTLQGVDFRNDGNLNGTLEFVDFNNLQGGSGQDTFELSATGFITGQIDGGTNSGDPAPSDIVDVSGASSPIIVQIDGNAINGNATTHLDVTGIEDIRASGSGNSLITAPSGSTSWTVNGANSGNINNEAILFSGFDALQGNAAADLVTITTDGAVNSFALLNGSNTISVQGAGTVNSITGGANDDQVTIGNENLDVEIEFGDGNDTLFVDYSFVTNWLLNDSQQTAVAYNQTTETDLGTITFNDNDLEIIQGNNSGADNFSIASDSLTVTQIQGRGGNDTFTITETSNFNLSVNGNSGSDTLIGANRSNDWIFGGSDVDEANTLNFRNASNRGIVFDQVENFTGNSGEDHFDIRNVAGIGNGLIDGGESGAETDTVEDTLDLTDLVNGVIVELGPNASAPPGTVSDRGNLVSVNVNNIESITAADEGTPGVNEDNNWVAITHDNGVRWDFTEGFGVDDVINEGYVLELSVSDGSDITNSRVDLHNFGSLQGGNESEDLVNVVEDNSISGTHVAGDGLRNLRYSGDILVVVDIDEQIDNVEGNGNVLLRVAEGSDFDGLAISNDWIIHGENEGIFNGNVNGEGVASFSFTFSGVNQFEGGIGEDTFIFAENVGDETTTGSLLNGRINGGRVNEDGDGVNIIDVSSATGNLAFGIGEVSDTASTPGAVYAGAGTPISPVFLVENRAEDDAITEVVNVNQLNDTGEASNLTLYSSDNASTNTTWTIAGSGNSVVERLGSDTRLNLSFSGVENIIGSDSNDHFDIDSLSVVTNNFDGGSGSNTLNIEDVASRVTVSTNPAITSGVDIQIAGIETLTASDNGNTLIGGSSSNTWNLTTTNNGSLVYDNGTGSTTVAYTNFSHLIGGEGLDEFTISAISNTPVWGTIDGGDASGSVIDRILVTANSGINIQLSSRDGNGRVLDGGETSRLDIAGVEVVDANGTLTNTEGVLTNSIYGRTDTSNDWYIHAADNSDPTRQGHSVESSGDSVSFSNFENLTGGDLVVDTFNFDDSLVAGLVNGGSDSNVDDVVNLQNLDGITVHVGDRTPTSDLNIVDIEDINALDPSASSYTLRGDDIGTNTWQVRYDTVENQEQDDLLNEITFSGFENLVGGTGTDNFTIGAGVDISGYNTIDGAAGTNTLSTVDYDEIIVISLDATEVSADIRVSNVDEITANASLSNSIIGPNAVNTWDIGGAGVNVNAGILNPGANQVVFAGFANLTGNAQQDIFTFAQTTDNIEGLIDGRGQGSDPDTLDVTGLVNGVVVELGEGARADIPDAPPSNVQANNIELINAFDDDNESDGQDFEANNWLVNNTTGDFLWNITGRNSGTLGTSVVSPSITFNNFAYIVGSDGFADEFRFQNDATITNQFVGGDGGFEDYADFRLEDSPVVIAINSSDDEVINFAGVERFIGNNDGLSAGGANSTFRVDAGANTWTIGSTTTSDDGTNDGRVLVDGTDTYYFENFNHLAGGTGADQFNFNTVSNVTGSIDGGTNTDSNVDDVINTVAIVSRIIDAQIGGTEFGRLNINDIEQIEASGAGNILRAGVDSSNDWDITDVNRGTLNTNLEFIGFSSLFGGSGVDDFTVRPAGSVTNIDGLSEVGLGDVLEVQSDDGEEWFIDGEDQGRVTDRVDNFQSIENIVGGVGADSFEFVGAAASITGLIDGAESSEDIDGSIDTLDISSLGTGVVVELGPDALQVPGTVTGREGFDRVNVYNIEEITAANDTTNNSENEANNWLAITHDNGVRWDFSQGVDDDNVINEGFILELNGEGASINNSRIDLHNFGSLQGGVGSENPIDVTDETISGVYIPGTGLRTLSYSGNSFVVVDIDNRIAEVRGNGNVLLRIAPASEFDIPEFVGDPALENDWIIHAENAGTFNGDVDSEGLASFSFEFSGVNQLEGGEGNDTFEFVERVDVETTSGSLVNGTINGGGGANVIEVSSATGDLAFGIGQVSDVEVVPSVIYPVTGIPPVFPVLNRQLNDGITEIVGIQRLDDTGVDSRVTLNSGMILGSASEWTLNSGESTLVDSGNDVSISFTGVERAAGGATDDTFDVRALDAVENTYDGGTGSDTVSLVEMIDSLSVVINNPLVSGDIAVSGVEYVNANSDLLLNNTLYGTNENSTWNIGNADTSVNAGDVEGVNFSGFSQLVGGSEEDEFIFDGTDQITGLIQTGEGEDTLNIVGLTNPTRVAIGNEVDVDINVVGVETINASDNNNELIAASESNIWQIDGRDEGDLTGSTYDIRFDGFANLTGGSDTDTFNLGRVLSVNDAVTGIIRGGVNGGNAINLDDLISPDAISVAIGTVNSADFNLVDIQTIGATNGVYRLIGDNVENTWTIRGENAGDLNEMTFSGFAFLEGGSGNDSFTLARQEGATEDDRITGSIDGGAAPTSGTANDIVDLTGLVDAVTVSLDTTYVGADLQISRVRRINAASQNMNTLVGTAGENTWNLDEQNAGSVEGINFTEFANLIGRASADTFIFTEEAAIDGFVDGGHQPDGQRDVVNMRDLSGPVNIVIGDNTDGFVDIEEFIGNGNAAVITAENVENTWTIDGGNSGRIETEETTMAFSGFGILEGGSNEDHFILNGGSVGGEIRAGAGSDDLLVTVVENVNGQVRFIGGEGNDDVDVVGGTENYTTTYTPDADGGASIDYELRNESSLVTYTVEYDQVEEVDDQVVSSALTVNDLNGQQDRISVADDTFAINSNAMVTYGNKESVVFSAENGDSVILDGQITVNNTFEIVGAGVSVADNTTSVQALSTVFSGNDSVGAQDARINLNTNDLALENIQGNAYIREENTLNISTVLNPLGIVDIVAVGAITDSGVLSSTREMLLQSENSDITLDSSNNISGALSLSASGSIELNNNAATILNNVNAQNFTLNAGGNVSDIGDITIAGSTTITGNTVSSNTVILDGENNDFGSLSIQSMAEAEVNDVNSIIFEGNVQDRVAVTAEQGVQTSGVITGDEILLTSNTSVVEISNSLTAESSILLSGEGVNVNASLTVSNNLVDDALTIQGGSSDVVLAGQVSATSTAPDAGRFVVSGASFTQQAGANIDVNTIEVDVVNGIIQSADVDAANVVDFTAENGDITMTAGTTTEAFEVNLTANDGDVIVQTIIADVINITGANVQQLSDMTATTQATVTSTGDYLLAENTEVSVSTGNASFQVGDAQFDGNIRADQGEVSIVSSGNGILSGDINAMSVNIVAEASVAMDVSGSIAAADSVSVAAGNDVNVTTVSASAVALTAETGSVAGTETGEANIVADTLSLASEAGIGTESDAIDLQVGELNASNGRNDVNISNTGDVRVVTLQNNGDIAFTNVIGSVTLASVVDATYDNTEGLDARDAGGVMNANYNEGSLTITLGEGDLVAATDPSLDRNRPDLAGRNVVVDLNGSFAGSGGRPIVVYAQDSFVVNATGGVLPIWGFGEEPDTVITPNDLADPTAAGSVSDLLVDVESVDEIDPAVFTEVRNYSYDNVSIRMPRDQLYDDDLGDDDEEEDENAELLL